MSAGAGVAERIRNNLEELGLDAMSSSFDDYASLVASGSRSFGDAMLIL